MMSILWNDWLALTAGAVSLLSLALTFSLGYLLWSTLRKKRDRDLPNNARPESSEASPYLDIVANSPDGILVLKANGDIAKGNAVAAKMFGTTPEELCGRDFESLAEENTDSLTAKFMKDLRQLGRATTELHLPGEDKPEIWKVDAVQQTNGELLLFAKDVTQLKQVERDALRHSRNLATIHKFESLMSEDMEAPSTVLQRMLEHVIADLEVEGACILVKNETGDRLEHVAWAGLSMDVPGLLDLPQGFDLPWKALSLGRICASKEDLRLEPHEARQEFFGSRGLVHHLAVPLMMQKRYRGVLELHHRFPIEVDNLFVEVLQTLASMLAASFERVEFFRELEKANSALLESYDATIEGWVGLLDARDNESEGHSKRVCELTLRLCRYFGVPEDQMTDIRRGALLHDIAKVAIPDNILLKPGPLNEDEWAVMKTHPEVAQRVLAKVPFLKDAAAIPFCHHERWDGSGYPQGLSGEEIPLAARIFAVVDVFDALTSERPYRGAWTCHKALGYIEQQAGEQFDPNVVEAFLQMMEQDGYTNANLHVG